MTNNYESCEICLAYSQFVTLTQVLHNLPAFHIPPSLLPPHINLSYR